MFALSPVLLTMAATTSPTIAPAVVGLGPLVGWMGLGMLKQDIQMSELASIRRQKWVWADLPVSFMFLFLSVGSLLGSIEVLLVAHAIEVENLVSAGLALAAWAAGSAFVAIMLGPKLASYEQHNVLMYGLITMTSFTSLLVIFNGSYLTLILCFMAGTGAAPAFSAGFALVSKESKAWQVTENLSWLTASMGIGTTIGIFAATSAISYFNLGVSFFVPVAFGIVATAISRIVISGKK
jgi:MFS family permease